jgi:hypothetical protein
MRRERPGARAESLRFTEETTLSIKARRRQSTGCPVNSDLRHQIFSHLFQCSTHSAFAQKMLESLYSIVMKRLNMHLAVPVGALVWT